MALKISNFRIARWTQTRRDCDGEQRRQLILSGMVSLDHE
jgi:hypothetical protein